MIEKKKIVFSYDECVNLETGEYWLENAKVEKVPKGVKAKIKIVGDTRPSNVGKRKALDISEACLEELFRASKPSISWAKVKAKNKKTGRALQSMHKIKLADYKRIKKKYRARLPVRWQSQFDHILFSFAPVVLE